MYDIGHFSVVWVSSIIAELSNVGRENLYCIKMILFHTGRVNILVFSQNCFYNKLYFPDEVKRIFFSR